MRISKLKLQKIINEELNRLLYEQVTPDVTTKPPETTVAPPKPVEKTPPAAPTKPPSKTISVPRRAAETAVKPPRLDPGLTSTKPSWQRKKGAPVYYVADLGKKNMTKLELDDFRFGANKAPLPSLKRSIEAGYINPKTEQLTKLGREQVIWWQGKYGPKPPRKYMPTVPRPKPTLQPDPFPTKGTPGRMD